MGRASWRSSLRGSRELEVRARTSYAVAEVGRRRLVSKKLVKRAPKRAAGASERGPRSTRPKAVTRRGCAKTRNGESPPRIASDIHGAKSGEGPGWRENVIQRSSQCRKAMRWSRDRGCNGHRILRRVPVDRRHLGSSRTAGFHGPVAKVASAVSPHSSDPRPLLPRSCRRGSTHEGA
jgi:hypothetical protein